MSVETGFETNRHLNAAGIGAKAGVKRATGYGPSARARPPARTHALRIGLQKHTRSPRALASRPPPLGASRESSSRLSDLIVINARGQAIPARSNLDAFLRESAEEQKTNFTVLSQPAPLQNLQCGAKSPLGTTRAYPRWVGDWETGFGDNSRATRVREVNKTLASPSWTI